MPPVTIRAAVAGDLETLARFQERMALETEGLVLSPEVVRRGAKAVIDDRAKGEYWVAQADGQVVGCLLTTFEWSDWRNASVLWIQSLFVEPAWRGRGVFRALFNELQRRVDADPGLAGIRLSADQRNAAACAIYERLGMSREHYFLYERLKG